MKIKASFLAICILIPTLPAYSSRPTPRSSADSLSERLGWVAESTQNNLCHGYYDDPYLFEPKDSQLGPDDIQTTAGKSVFYYKTGKSELSKRVEINQPGKRLIADHGSLYRDPVTGKISSIDLYGEVSLQEPGLLIRGDDAHINLTNETGEVNQTLYRVTRGKKNTEIVEHRVHDYGLNAWGTATKIERLENQVIQIFKGDYTTCPIPINSWKLKANRILLNRQTGRGQAYNASFWIKDIPVLYTPYINFPIDQRRQTGFLFPTFGVAQRAGFDTAIPYYINIAPNYDATITPRIMSLRGVQINGEFRYLLPNSDGQLGFGILPNDTEFRQFQQSGETQADFGSNPNFHRLENASDDRKYFSYSNNSKFGDHWYGHTTLNYVSDDYYFQDFAGNDLIGSTNQVEREGHILYQGENWDFLARAQYFQTLHPVNQTEINNQYARLPQLYTQGKYPDSLLGLDYEITSEYVNFDRARSPAETTEPVVGNRLHFSPVASYPILRLYGFAIPRIQFFGNVYDLRHQPQSFSNNQQLAVPIISLDSGLFFDNNIKLFNTSYTQTVEPRFFYLYVPFRDQTTIPVFDSALQTFNFDQLFRYNRFSGYDRVGDANQITAAISSRLLTTETGVEKLRVSAGQIFYFKNRDVTLCQTPGCANTEDPTATNQLSPTVFQLRYYLSSSWNAVGDLSWNFNNHEANNAQFNLHYQPGTDRLINFGYNFTRDGDVLYTTSNGQPNGSGSNSLNQIYGSFSWPLRPQWNTVGSAGYNLSHNHLQTFLAGLEYNSCCFASRIVVGRSFSSLNEKKQPEFDNFVYLQVQLKGLGNIGNTDVGGFLTERIKGYHDPYQTF